MRFVLACYGSRGDIEPCVAIGRELLRRGHDVQMVVPPDMVGFVEAAGLPATGYGPDLQPILDAHRNFWARLFRNPWRLPDLIRSRRKVGRPFTQGRDEVITRLTALAEGADVLFTGLNFEDVTANVAEYHDIPLATLHTFPVRANGQLLPIVPAPLLRSAMIALEWLGWRVGKKREDAERRDLGLPATIRPSLWRITDRGSLEIQAYDEWCFPGLAAEWAKFDGQRPFVGTLTLELSTEADEEVASWIAAGTPPIFFGFGSIAVTSAADTLRMISAACTQLGERALICSAGTDFSNFPALEHVKVVSAVNFATTFPACRAVVHHGGAGTTAAGLRAGIPTLSLTTDLDQTLWGAVVKRLKVGTTRRLSTTTQESLVEDLRTILAPEYVVRAREVAARMSKSSDSVTAAADLVENLGRSQRVA